VRVIKLFVLLLGVSASSLVAFAGSAAAQIDVRLENYDQALIVVSEELAHLQLLGRIEPPVSFELEMLPSNIGLRPGPQAELQLELDHLDQVEGPAVLRRLLDSGEEISPAVVEVLSANLEPSGLVNPAVYWAAYDSLLELWWSLGEFDPEFGSPVFPDFPGPSEFSEPPESLASAVAQDTIVEPEAEPAPTPTTVEQVTASISETIDEPARTVVSAGVSETVGVQPNDESPSGSTIPWSLVAIFTGIALAAVIALTVRARNRQVASGDRDLVLESGRRLLAAATLDELGTIAADRAVSLIGAARSSFVVGESVWTSGVAPDVPEDLVEQARRTGRTVRAAGQVVVPVVAAGRVSGHIALNDPDADPEVIEELAPLIGEGLTNVVRQQETETLAFVDGLTGVANRRRFDVERGSREAAADMSPVAVAMFDVDYFKVYNDTNGHQCGDEALQSVARLISENLRSEDTLYRYGGEEFAALLRGADLAVAQQVVERVRAGIEAHEFPGGSGQPGGRVTMSAGVAGAPTSDGQDMLRAADEALYRAKELGRNQVVLASSTPGSE
jgi:diguanylate cyclase (GGDEF)-like protein